MIISHNNALALRKTKTIKKKRRFLRKNSKPWLLTAVFDKMDLAFLVQVSKKLIAVNTQVGT